MKNFRERLAIIDRIKLVFKGLNNRKIAQILNTSAVSVGRWFKDNAIPPYYVLIDIANYGKVTLDWLMMGKEPMKLSDRIKVKKEGAPYEPTANLVILAPDELKSRLKELEPRESYVPVPSLPDSAIVNDPINIEDKDIVGFALIYKSWLQQDHIYRCIRIKDNSMSPILEEGFTIAIDCTDNDPSFLEGKIVAARYQDNLAIRKLLLTNEYYILQPQNTLKFQPIKIPITEQNAIIGKVVWWFGKS